MPSKIKKLKIIRNIIIAVLIMIFLAVFCAFRCAYIFFYLFYGSIGVKSCDELTQIFYENQSCFDEIADIGLSYDDSESISVYGVRHWEFFGFLTPGRYKFKDYQGNALKNHYDLKGEIKTSNIKRIFKKLNLLEVRIFKDEIQFIDRASFGFIRGIVYLKNNDLLYNNEYTTYTHLTGNWYVFDGR